MSFFVFCTCTIRRARNRHRPAAFPAVEGTRAVNPTTAHTFAAYVRGLGCAIKRLIMLEFGAGPVRRDAMR
ncbi:hypothetical protein [Burkholderia arboris]|uniref:hypothetical protein n=1 Tax=Burkholderia arboris TaxID=488730 RepID=UPI0015833FD8|nr:hypothetical protein [Burkholderia arboris]MCA8494118.1 hypothetical protein [Burkholderia arboris]